MRSRYYLCATTALALSVSSAFAQSAVAPQSKSHRHTQTHKSAAPKEDGPSMMGSTSPTDEARSETVRVQGSRRSSPGAGLMVHEDAAKSRSTVTQDFISKQTPGVNPMQLIAMLPGVNTTSVDPLGLNGGNMTMRGLNASQIGFTLEGFPINDIGNYAVYPQEIVDSENLRSINVEQGSADLDSPHISASGGAVNMYLLDPKDHFGGHLDGTYGSYNSRRIFGRMDTGKIGNTNLKGYVSFSAAHEDSWRGPGSQRKLHGETKWVNEWGQGNRISLAIVGNQSNSTLFPSMSLANWKKYGVNYTYTGKWNPSSPSTNYYKLHQNPFTNIYASAPSTFTLTDHLTLTETPYFWYGNGNGGGAYSESLSSQQYGAQTLSASIGQYNSSNTKSLLVYNPSNTQTYRPGAVTKLALHTGANRLMIGYWFEYSKQLQTSPYSLVNMATGTPLDVYGGGTNMVLSNGVTAEYRDTLTQTRIHTLFIDDSLSLLNNHLTLEAGLKYAMVARQGHNFLPDTSTGPYINGSWNEPLPAASIRYKLNNEIQLFASGTTNFRIPMNTALYDAGTYTSGSGYSTKANTNMKPEISISEEAGIRYQGALFNGTLSYFHYNFTNRLYSETVVQSNGAYYSTSVNGGSSHADGVDFEIGTRPILYHLRPYISAEYIDARTDSNVAAGGSTNDYVHSKGKFAPQTAKVQVAFNLDYDDGAFFSGFGLKYVGKQYATFNNDTSIPGYVTMDVHAGYRFRNYGVLKNPVLKLNIQNITNNHYLGFVNGTASNGKATTGVFGSAIAAGSTTYYVASPFFVGGSASVDF